MLDLNWIDCVMLVIVGFSILAGLARGLVKEIIALIALIAAFVVASLFSSPLADSITNTSSMQGVLNHASSSGTHAAAQNPSIVIGLSFALLFVGTMIVFGIISFVLNLIIQSSFLSIGNRLFGAIFGFARGCLIDLAIIFLVQLTSYSQAHAWRESQVAKLSQPAVVWLGAIVSPSLAKLEETYSQPTNAQPTNATTMPNANKNTGTP